jgi:hypothetical protein
MGGADDPYAEPPFVYLTLGRQVAAPAQFLFDGGAGFGVRLVELLMHLFSGSSVVLRNQLCSSIS